MITIKKILFLFLLIYLAVPLFDKSLYTQTILEKNEINKRYAFYSNEMGSFYTKNIVMRFYLNKVFPIANKYFYKLAHPK